MQDAEMSALKTLRSGFFYLSAAMAMLIAVVEFTPAVYTYVSSSVGIMVMVVFFTLLLPSAIAVFLYAVFWVIRPGMRQLSEVDGRFRVCYTGTTLILVGLAVLALGTAAVVALATVHAESSLALTVWVLLVGGTIAFTGYVLTFVAGAFKLYGKYRNPLYVAAVLLLTSGVLSALTELLWLVPVSTAGLSRILTAVGYVLTYAALDGTIKKLNAQS
ncbi:MAG: DUF973 family protein [Pyrobaculum sp.]|jgi:hypothetical protein